MNIQWNFDDYKLDLEGEEDLDPFLKRTKLPKISQQGDSV